MKSQKTDNVEITLQPSELEYENPEELGETLKAKYEEKMAEEQQKKKKEDLSDMVSEDAQKKKRKLGNKEKDSSKKYKNMF